MPTTSSRSAAALELRDAVFVGHSVSAMIGALATLKAPGMFSDLVMVGPSPRYIDDGDYVGGFSREQVEELLEFLADNHLGWSAAMAPAIMGNPDRPELGAALANSFCHTDPDIARDFARATFLSDNRADLPNDRGADAGPAVQRRHHRADRGRRICPRPHPRQRLSAARRHRPLPEPQRARRK